MRIALPPLLITAALTAILGADGTAAQTVSGTARNGGAAIREAAIWLEPLDGNIAVSPDPVITIDQAHLRFVPSVVVTRPGTEVSFENSDDVLHNVFGPGGAVGHDFDLGTYDRGESRSEIFQVEGVHIVLCHIHPEMVAFVLVVDTPYSAISGADGTWSIEGVPPGRYRLHAWQSRRWRDELTGEIVVPAGGASGIQVTLGSNGSIR